ncbi:MAG TPA: Gfo/Idh/MocA family oxidoreductase [Steroidobacteraceae bacterium]|nr:Gfo/Idh/MocA family oxidoreductase [Steroidobacteraceae bacterium]
MERIKIAVVGLGKIARDQHIPSLRSSGAFELVAVASPHHQLEGTPSFGDLPALLRAVPEVHAVALCTTPQVRYELAQYALERGRHVLLEKPPGVTVSEVLALVDLAHRRGVGLFASWHSRHARAVEPARLWLAGRKILAATVTWKEDVRVWHPGQPWIWQAGGLGVFDPGINALSILTRIIPGSLALKSAELCYPRNCETPIAARLILAESHGAAVQIELDFRQTGHQTWDIEVDTDAGRLHLSSGGALMAVNGQSAEVVESSEYACLYAQFADLVRRRAVDVDCTPMQLVADAFLCGRRIEVEPFIE